MGIKLRNCDKDSSLKKFYLTFDTDNTATGTQKTSVIVPMKAQLESISFSCETDASACAGNAVHIVVQCSNVTTATAIIDYTVTGACAGAISANVVTTISPTAVVIAPAFSNFTINISASSLVGPAHGIMVFKIDPSVKD